MRSRCDATSGKTVWQVPLPKGGDGPVAFSPDDRLVAAALSDPLNQILILGAGSGKPVRTIEGLLTVRPAIQQRIAFTRTASGLPVRWRMQPS